jgi:hypothetical protein
MRLANNACNRRSLSREQLPGTTPFSSFFRTDIQFFARCFSLYEHQA